LAHPDPVALEEALKGCDAVVHCAGINREIGSQTYDAVHVRGTQALVSAARAAGVEHISVLSFLRARPDGPTAYHRTKWATEAIVRDSGIPHTVLKAGVIHGRGDHMLDHLSHALYTFPVFGLVGMRDQLVRPVAVDDVARILAAAAAGDDRLRNQTVAVLGPEEMTLAEAVRRVAHAVGRRPSTFVYQSLRTCCLPGSSK
jgi:NADH dehydrogenase